MKKILHILRRENAEAKPYWEDFPYETADEGATVATALASTPVVWEHSCLQRRCGGCAMVINQIPALACNTRLSEIPSEVIQLEPLRKFPVIEDLLVDRSVMMQNLRQLSVWMEEEAQTGSEEMAFEAARCLQCGLCLEVCPNFAAGEAFAGMAAMAPMSRLIARLSEGERKRIAKEYQKGVYNGCGKSLACRDICPAKLPIDELLVRSNAACVWKRWKSVKWLS